MAKRLFQQSLSDLSLIHISYDDDTINTHISHIRKKIKAITNEDYIQTIWGIGYKIK